MRNERGRADLSWTSVGAWLDAPLLLFPSGALAFTLPERVLAAGWQNAPKLLIVPFGGHAVTLPKRALAAGDAGRLVEVPRTAGARERRRFGLIAAKGVSARQRPLWTGARQRMLWAYESEWIQRQKRCVQTHFEMMGQVRTKMNGEGAIFIA
jgi:hypothetical protein